MQDWQALELGNFRKKNISFNLKTLLRGLEKFMQDKAEAKKLKVIMHTNYTQEINLVSNVSFQEILNGNAS